MARNGWIKLHRNLLDNPMLMGDPDILSIWIWLLLNAVHVDGVRVMSAGKEYILSAGQILTGRAEISEQTGVNASKVQRTLTKLENEHMIEQQTNSRNRVISIVNWNRYQFTEQVNEQVSEQVSEQVVNRYRTDSEQPTIYIKNEKNINNDKNIDARARVRHEDGVSISDRIEQMREQIRRGRMEYAEWERHHEV